MRLIGLGAAVVVGFQACGGDQPAGRGPSARPANRVVSGPLVEVQMIGDRRRWAAFEPAALTAAPGVTFRFVNVSGGPHNVVFWPDSIPPGSADLLDAAMASRMAYLSGPLLTRSNETHEVTIPPTAPPGRYRGYCLSHVALGMTIAITVR